MDEITMDDITSDASLAGDDHMTASDGLEAVNPNALTLDELNAFLGKDFKDKQTALKSLKDTTAYVGKVGQLEKQVQELSKKPERDYASADELRQLKEELFFSQNPQYKDYRSVIAKMGDNASDVVNSEEFKMVYEKARGFDEVQNTRTVLQSNPRLAQVTNKLDEARQAADAGKTEAAKELAAKAVIEAFPEIMGQ